MIVNWVPTKTGRVRAVCEWCDRRSKPVQPRPDGRPSSIDLAGWSCAPFPVDYIHADGSLGSLYTCPACAKLRNERQRAGIRPLLTPSPQRAEAIRTRQEQGL